MSIKYKPLSEAEESIANKIVDASYNVPLIKNGIKRIIL